MKNIHYICLFCGIVLLGAHKICAVTNFVGAFGSPNGNYFTIIQQAIDNSSVGDLVLVSNGVYNSGGGITPGYSLSNRLVITKNITVKSVSGPENTLVLGAPDIITGSCGSNAVRCAYLSSGELIGFTFSNGFTAASGNYYYERSGAGVFFDHNGSISNCVVTHNFANYYAGGVWCYFGGTIKKSDIIYNSASYGGGGSCYKGGRLDSCTIEANFASSSAGGVNCNNSASLNNCLIINNSAETTGGGVAIAYGGSLNNCTIAYNFVLSDSSSGGGGVFCSNGGNLYNCIVYFNSSASSYPNWRNTSDGAFTNSCSFPLMPGFGNISDVPQFVGRLDDDFRLRPESPCVDAGSNDFVTSTLDIIGFQRIYETIVDMGCYECKKPPIILTNSLIFPENNSIIFAPFKTNIIWNYKNIFDNNDETNLTITKIAVLNAATTNEVALIENNISNLTGQISWIVPEILVGGSNYYVLQFDVVDSSFYTNSRVFWNNKFTIIPEPAFFIFCFFWFLLRFRFIRN